MRILVAVDKESANVIADFLISQNWDSKTQYRVVTVFDTTSDDYCATERSAVPFLAQRAYGEGLLNLALGTAARIKDAYPDAVTESSVLEGDVAVAIATEAFAWHADLIAIGSHHRHGVDKWVYGSVSEKVLHCSTCSILVVPVPVKASDTNTCDSSQRMITGEARGR